MASPKMEATETQETLQNFDAFPLTALDRKILSMTDDEFKSTDWDELKQIICMCFFSLCSDKPSPVRLGSVSISLDPLLALQI